MSRYLITGVAGFVGRYFVEYLNNSEPEAIIYGVDVSPSCDMDILYQSMNLNNAEAVSGLISDIRPDYLLHLASVSSVYQSWQDPATCFRNNTGIMLNILESIVKLGLKTRVLSIGSSEEYGDVMEDEMPINETHPLNPKNPYAVAKASQEMLCKLYANNMDIDVVMTRSFNHIGPRQNDSFVVPSFIRQLLAIRCGKQDELLVGNIDVARDFMDVRDVVKAYYSLLHYGERGEVYNVCSGRAVTLRSIIERVEGLLQFNAKIVVDDTRLRPNEIKLIVGDNTKLKTSLGWVPACKLDDTLQNIIASIEQTTV